MHYRDKKLTKETGPCTYGREKNYKISRNEIVDHDFEVELELLASRKNSECIYVPEQTGINGRNEVDEAYFLTIK